MDKKHLLLSVSVLLVTLLLTACSSKKNLIVPRAVSTAEAIPAEALNLKKGDYQIMRSVTESASVTAKYSSNELKIVSSDGDFSYTFKFINNSGWTLSKFSGTATFGYLLQDVDNPTELPGAEEFARRVAIARLIEKVKDFGADGVLEPIVTTRASNVGHNTVEYQANVTAKIVKINPTK